MLTVIDKGSVGTRARTTEQDLYAIASAVTTPRGVVHDGEFAGFLEKARKAKGVKAELLGMVFGKRGAASQAAVELWWVDRKFWKRHGAGAIAVGTWEEIAPVWLEKTQEYGINSRR